MTYHKHLEDASNTLLDTFDPVASSLLQIGSIKQVDPARSNGVVLGATIANMKRARDRIDAALESLELARSAATILAAKEGGPTVTQPCAKLFRPHIIATGNPPVRDYPDQPA